MCCEARQPTNKDNTAMTRSRSGKQGGRANAAVTRHDQSTPGHGHAKEALALLVKVMNNKKASPQTRVVAAQALLDHGWDENLREEARDHAHLAVIALLGMMNDAGATPRTRLAAATALLECGRGGPTAPTAPTASATIPSGQRWLDEIAYIQEQFAAGQSIFDRPSHTPAAADTPRREAASRHDESPPRSGHG